MTAIFYSLVLSSWHALLLLGCAWLLCRLSGSQAAWIRHHIWLFALLAVVLLPLWSGIASQLQIQQLHGAEGFAPFVNLPETFVSFSRVEPLSTQAAINFSLPEKQQVFDWSFYFPTVLLVFWVCGAGITAGKVCLESLRLSRFRRNSRFVTIAEIDCPGINSSETGATVSFALSEEVCTPMLAGVFHPVILLPADIQEWTKPEERRWIIEHELVHLARRDNIVVVFQALLGIIFFFHPLVRFALRQLSVERELACDEQVISRGANPAPYAESLLKAARRSLSPPFATASVSFAARKTLQKRIDNIMNLTISKKSRLFFALPTASIIFVMFLLGCTQASRTSRDEQEIRAFLDKAAEFEINGGVEDFDRLSAAEFIRIGADGDIGDKARALDSIRQKGKSNLQSIEMQNEQIRIYGDTAVVTGLGVAHGQNNAGDQFVVRNLCTFVLVKRDGRWQCVSVQQTRQA